MIATKGRNALTDDKFNEVIKYLMGETLLLSDSLIVINVNAFI